MDNTPTQNKTGKTVFWILAAAIIAVVVILQGGSIVGQLTGKTLQATPDAGLVPTTATSTTGG